MCFQHSELCFIQKLNLLVPSNLEICFNFLLNNFLQSLIKPSKHLFLSLVTLNLFNQDLRILQLFDPVPSLYVRQHLFNVKFFDFGLQRLQIILDKSFHRYCYTLYIRVLILNDCELAVQNMIRPRFSIVRVIDKQSDFDPIVSKKQVWFEWHSSSGITMSNFISLFDLGNTCTPKRSF